MVSNLPKLFFLMTDFLLQKNTGLHFAEFLMEGYWHQLMPHSSMIRNIFGHDSLICKSNLKNDFLYDTVINSI